MGVLRFRLGPFFVWVVAGLGAVGCSDTPKPASNPHRSPSAAVDVTLPAHAADALVVRDSHSRLDIAATLIGARPSAAEKTKEGTAYREVFPGAELRHRLTVDGVEDSIAFAHAPAAPEVSYALRLSPRSRALRLVENTLELLDETGAPRLRVSPPFVIDRDGVRHAAALHVDGCAVDTNPAAPWGRALTELGSRRCVLRVAWSTAVRYPAVLDPQWTGTGSMAFERSNHVAVPVASGGNALVLVAGGVTFDPVAPPLRYPTTPSAELYDPASRTFSVTGSMNEERSRFCADTLKTGSVLVEGGRKTEFDGSLFKNVILQSSELYDPSTGTWALTRDGSSAVTQMLEAREGNTSTMLGDGKVLVAGGGSQYSGATAEIFDPATGTWAYTTDGSAQTLMTTPRGGHSATLLPDGTVLVAGGYTGTEYSSTAEIFSPLSGKWTATGSMLDTRTGHTATLIGSLVLVNGGESNQSELYDSVAGTWRATSGAPLVSRYGHTTTLLVPGGPVLVTGGDGEIDESGHYAPRRSAELYIPAIDAWHYTDNLPNRLSSHTATLLSTGGVLITGGENYYTDMGAAIASAAYEFDKVLCSVDADCRSGEGCSPNGICKLSNGSRCTTLDGTRCLSGICARQATGLFCSPCQTCMELDPGGTTCVPMAANTQCYFPSCSNSVETRRACDGAGACVGTSTDCPGNHSCQSFGACYTACTTDFGCRPGYVCNPTSGECFPKKLVGESCTAGWQCEPGAKFCVWSPAAAGFVCARCAACSVPDASGSNCVGIPVGTPCGPASCQGGALTTQSCDAAYACTTVTSPCGAGMTCDLATASCVGPADAGSADATTRVDAGIRDGAAVRDAGSLVDATKPIDATPPDARPSADAANPRDAASTPADATKPDGGTKPPPVTDAANPRDGSKVADAAKPRDASKVADAAKRRDGAPPDSPPVRDATGAPPAPTEGGARADARGVAGTAVEGGGCGCELAAKRDGGRREYLAWFVVLAFLTRRRSSAVGVRRSKTTHP